MFFFSCIVNKGFKNIFRQASHVKTSDLHSSWFYVTANEEHPHAFVSKLRVTVFYKPAAQNLLLKILQFVSIPHYIATAICLADQRRPTQRGSARLNTERTTL